MDRTSANKRERSDVPVEKDLVIRVTKPRILRALNRASYVNVVFNVQRQEIPRSSKRNRYMLNIRIKIIWLVAGYMTPSKCHAVAFQHLFKLSDNPRWRIHLVLYSLRHNRINSKVYTYPS
ncbi:unnamed protein product [Macrosiphum euphorbiae]|uniref:Uncharacterized protein n=1 Tax=Macrosiphum euphorbiae TaxID=13131 RepID=A0AAV0XPS9_9HEMI|nr:unnamed protein product [Macrosiphum euphorbiae]